MTRWFLALLLSCIAVTAHAHKIKIFSYVELQDVLGQVYFVGGKPAVGLVVSLSADNEVERVAQTDKEGRFLFKGVEAGDYQIIADAGEGHVARWSFVANDFPSFQAVGAIGRKPNEQSNKSVPSELTTPDAETIHLDRELLERLIEESVARQVSRQTAPLRADLNSYADQVKFGDTLGGIGYIVGLFGLYAWWRSRK